MTTISAKIVADSISPAGKRLTTMHCRYPLMVHAELLTHRVFSRNARSSRAVPIPKLIEECMTDPVVPIHWGANRPGMQATEECDNAVEIGIDHDVSVTRDRLGAWLFARDRAVEVALGFHHAGYHKQNVNRLLAPFLHIDTLISSTEWDNFFALRDHHMAEPHIEALAKAMKRAMAESTPRRLSHGDWHMPYVSAEEKIKLWNRGADFDGGLVEFNELLLKLSTARCARISYEPFDGDASIEAELKRYDLLVVSAPLHASPAEHQATPDSYIDDKAVVKQWARPDLHANFVGWRQFRKSLPGECVNAAA